MYLLDNETVEYVWNKNWILPHESLWGITEKFKYLNVLRKLKCKGLSIKYVANREIKDDMENYIFCDGVRYKSQELADFFHIDYSNHFTKLNIFKDNKLASFMDKNIKICPQCMRFGYHSYYHQLLFEDFCFIHPGGKLLTTDIVYSIDKYEDKSYSLAPELRKYLVEPMDLINYLISNKLDNFSNFHPAIGVEHIGILNFNNPLQLTNDHPKEQYLQKLFHNQISDRNERVVVQINKSIPAQIWESYNYSNTWFSDYCYLFSEKIRLQCNSTDFFQTKNEFNSAYIKKKLGHSVSDYNSSSIAAILTAAILSGYTNRYEGITDIFDVRWYRRYHVCFLENEFNSLIEKYNSNCYKTAFIELYKEIIECVHLFFLQNADAGLYNQKTQADIDMRFDLPIYILVETESQITIVAT